MTFAELVLQSTLIEHSGKALCVKDYAIKGQSDRFSGRIAPYFVA